MVKKTGLGKGLDALFSMPIAEEEVQKEGDILRNLKIVNFEILYISFSLYIL